MEKIPPDCLEVIARSIATSDSPWLCDVVADAASLSLAGNDTCTTLSRLIQEAVEPGCSSSQHKHLLLMERTQMSKKQKRWQELDDKYARLIRYSRQAVVLAYMYADKADAESLTTLAEMDERMADLRDLLEGRGCTLRLDSALCRTFIEEGIGHPPEIADTMEEMQFFFRHTEYRFHMQSWHFSDLAKEVALKQWVMEHGALSTVLPPSLRNAAAQIAIDLMLDPIRVPTDLRQSARELIRGLDSIDALLKLQSELGARLEAVESAVERISQWGRDATAFFGSESDVLNADEEIYKERHAASQAMWHSGLFKCSACQKSWSTAQQLADHFRGKHGVVPLSLTPRGCAP